MRDAELWAWTAYYLKTRPRNRRCVRVMDKAVEEKSDCFRFVAETDDVCDG